MEENKKAENDGSKFRKVPKNEVQYNVTTEKKHSDFGKRVLTPFISGVLGGVIVVGTCFGVPSIKDKLIGTSSSNTVVSSSNNSSTNSNGYVDSSKLSEYSDTAVYAANKILPSIVGISIEYTVNSNSLFGFGTPTSQTATASGSGIIISEDGYILTNNHVVSSESSSEEDSFFQISEATKITVKLFNDDTEYEAKIIGKDKQTDLAVIKIDKTGLTKAEFADSDTVKVGQFAMAVGNPVNMESTVTTGVVSAVNRKITDSDGKSYTCIQTDAAINAGNSGGALVNSEGKVIGINTLKLSGTGIEGIGFAIPINSTTDITSQLIQYSKVKRPYIGIAGIDLSEEMANKYHLVTGVYVKEVETFSAAEKAGLKAGDVIIEADDQKITKMDELNEIKNKHKIGDTIKLKINRDGKEQEISVTLGEQP